MNLNKMEVIDLLLLYGSIIETLRDKKIVRTGNNIIADYAEYLVSTKMNLKLAPNSTPGYDALDNLGVRYQIKARRITTHNPSRQLGVLRNLKKNSFDYLIGVIFDEYFNVIEAYQIPHSILEDYGRESNHQNGRIIRLKGDILNNPNVKNILFYFK